MPMLHELPALGLKAISTLTTGDVFIARDTYNGFVAGNRYTFLRWAGVQFSVRDRDGDYFARRAVLREKETGRVFYRDMSQHGCVKVRDI